MEGLRTPPDRARHPLDDCSLEACSQCNAYLGLAPPTISAPAKCWLCGRCGSAYFAVTANQHGRLERTTSARSVAYEDVLEAATMTPGRHRVPRRELHDVLQYLATVDHRGEEKRSRRRFAIAMPVRALPLGATSA